MREVLQGVKVVEVASWTFVPAAGAVLADWGADVLKIEHPVTGDPQRGLISSGLIPAGAGGINYIMEQPNRGKRSVALDLGTDEGRELLYRLAETADVFLTNFLPDARERLLIDVEHIRARNPDIIYVRGTGQGVRGPDARKGGYDGASYWARGGLAMALTPAGLEWPISPRPAFGDVMGGMTIAGGIAAALFRRERTGEPSVVDVSLLGLALWNLGPDVVASKLYETKQAPKFDRAESPNPIVGVYRTQDGRFIMLMMLESDRYWADFCRHIERPELIDDPRFEDAAARYENRRECVGVLDEVFASRPFAEWRDGCRRSRACGRRCRPSARCTTTRSRSPTATCRRSRPPRASSSRSSPTPCSSTRRHPTSRHAPDHGQHTEEVLLELGLTWPEIAAHKDSGAIL